MNKTSKYLSFLPLAVASAPLITVSCSPFKNDNSAQIEVKQVRYVNLAPQYDVPNNSINFYYKDNSDVPLIDVDEMINKLDGFFNTNQIWWRFGNVFTNKKTYRWGKYSMVIDWYKNTISINDLSFFNFTKKLSGIDYSQFLKFSEFYELNEDGSRSKNNWITFDLGAFNFDILRYKSKILMPLSIFNLLFCSNNYYNLYYNGEFLIGNYFNLSDQMGGIEKIKDNPLAGRMPSKENREETYNFIDFAMSYFYGLKENKKITSTFSKWLSLDDKNKLLSRNVNDNNEAYGNIFHKKLNELHTRVEMVSFYNQKDKGTSDFSSIFTSEKEQQYWTKKEYLRNLRASHLGANPSSVRYYKDAAIITFDSFKVGTKSEILSGQAWKYDTYYLMYAAMEDIKAKGGVRKVLIDLSLNGGGSVAAMWKALGFLTDEIIQNYEINTLENKGYITGLEVDTDGDGRYQKDSYDYLKWYVLGGENTFSAANEFVGITQGMGLATLIGQQTGGGACSILPLVLPDGTSLVISSNNKSKGIYKRNNPNEKPRFFELEEGLKPWSQNLLDYNYFYNDAALYNLMK